MRFCIGCHCCCCCDYLAKRIRQAKIIETEQIQKRSFHVFPTPPVLRGNFFVVFLLHTATVRSRSDNMLCCFYFSCFFSHAAGVPEAPGVHLQGGPRDEAEACHYGRTGPLRAGLGWGKVALNRLVPTDVLISSLSLFLSLSLSFSLSPVSLLVACEVEVAVRVGARWGGGCGACGRSCRRML